MIELNDMIISHLEERGSAFPNVKKGILVPMVSTMRPFYYILIAIYPDGSILGEILIYI